MPTRRSSGVEWCHVRNIGDGAQGSASLVQNIRSGELAVRKKMTVYELLHDDTSLEALILQEILPSSRHIVGMFACGFEPDRHHNINLVQWFEYCRGGDLQHAVGGVESFPEDFIWHCFIQLAHALHVIHNCGSQRVVHRDIKPDNIFLDQKYRHEAPWPNLKVGDFGTAVLEEHTEGIHVPCWHGPEIPHLSPAGDIWSLGAIIHWLGHGRPPMRRRPASFGGSQEMWEDLPEARRPKALPRCYSGLLNGYMLECLEWDPRNRISSDELVECLTRDRPQLRGR